MPHGPKFSCFLDPIALQLIPLHQHAQICSSTDGFSGLPSFEQEVTNKQLRCCNCKRAATFSYMVYLSLCRVKRLLERAPRSIKLVADPEALEVVAEDEQLLVASKPAGVRSAPVHRFQGNSMLSRMIGHLGYEPHLLHR